MATATLDVDAKRTNGHGEGSLALFAYLDVALVILALPIVLLAGGPMLGYALGAGGWLVQRVVGFAIDRYAAKGGNARRAMLFALAGLFLRLWIIVLAIILAARIGDRADGLVATVVVLFAFTAYFALAIALRQHPGRPPRRGSVSK